MGLRVFVIFTLVLFVRWTRGNRGYIAGLGVITFQPLDGVRLLAEWLGVPGAAGGGVSTPFGAPVLAERAYAAPPAALLIYVRRGWRGAALGSEWLWRRAD